MSTIPANEPPVSKDTLLLVGPVFMGCVLSWLIFGISIVQLYIYHIWFPNDRRSIQALVYWVFILDIFLTVVAGAMGWHVLCAGWGRQTNLITPGWTFSAIAGGDGIIATTVQLFYSWRIWVLTRWRIIPGLVVVISLAQLASTISISAGIANLQDIAGLQPYFPRTTIWLGGGALADIIVAISMVYLLTTAKKNSRVLNKNDRVVNRLIRLSVETGSLTAASAIMELGFFLGPTTKNTNLHLFFGLILGKIYSNAMMTSLNSRLATHISTGSSRGGTTGTGDSSGVGSLSIPGTHSFRTGTTSVRTARGPTAPVVHIASHTEVFADSGYPSDRDDDKNQTLADDMEMMDRKPVRNDHFESFSPV